jgi:hypothetical protein|tara:strand:+ start:5600 stop:5887 length:288 start_codon:yes stop_codon:yes gene_type:complete
MKTRIKKKPRKSKVDMAKEKAEVARFGTSYVMSLEPVKNKILNKEKPIPESKIFDFSWSQGEPVKLGKKEKKEPKDQKMSMSFYNIRSKRYNPPR